MKRTLFTAAALVCLVSAVAYAQTGFAGKWVTDPPAAAVDGAGGGGRGGRYASSREVVPFTMAEKIGL